MPIQTITGWCTHLEVDAEDGLTTATLAFRTPSNSDTLGLFIARLTSGIEVLVPLPNDKEPDDDD